MNETTELIMKQLNQKKTHAITHEVGGGDEIDVTKLKNIGNYLETDGDFTGTWNGLEMTAVDPGLSTSFNALKTDVLQRAINVCSAPYNADSTGTLDSAAAITAAISAFGAGGGTLFFPPGTYKLVGSGSNDVPRVLLNKNNIHVLGYGATISNGVNRGLSTFKVMGADIVIEGLKFYGNDTSINQIHIGYTAKRVTIRNCEISNSKQQSIDTIPATGIMISDGAKDITIDTCWIHHVDASAATKIARGIWGTAYDAGGNTRFTGVHIRNCLFEDITPVDDADGIQLQPSNSIATIDIDSSIVDCKFYRCAKRAIKVQASGVTVRGNFIELSAYSATPMHAGISVYGNDITISENKIIGEYALNGIDVGSTIITAGIRAKIMGNTVKMSYQDSNRGINCVGTITDLKVIGNHLEFLRDGVYLNCAGDRAVINGNTIKTCSKSAIINFGDGVGGFINRLVAVGNSCASITEYIFRNTTGTQAISMGNSSDMGGFGTFGNASERISAIGNMIFGSPIQAHGSAIPTTGSWIKGDFIWNTSVISGGIFGWICVSSGTPGTWKIVAADVHTSIASTPSFIGQLAVVGALGYMAVGTSSSADWKQITN